MQVFYQNLFFITRSSSLTWQNCVFPGGATLCFCRLLGEAGTRFLPLALRAPHVAVFHAVHFATLLHIAARLLVQRRRFGRRGQTLCKRHTVLAETYCRWYLKGKSFSFWTPEAQKKKDCLLQRYFFPLSLTSPDDKHTFWKFELEGPIWTEHQIPTERRNPRYLWT